MSGFRNVVVGAILGGTIGSVWSPDRTLTRNVLWGLWRAVKPRGL